MESIVSREASQTEGIKTALVTTYTRSLHDNKEMLHSIEDHASHLIEFIVQPEQVKCWSTNVIPEGIPGAFVSNWILGLNLLHLGNLSYGQPCLLLTPLKRKPNPIILMIHLARFLVLKGATLDRRLGHALELASRDIFDPKKFPDSTQKIVLSWENRMTGDKKERLSSRRLKAILEDPLKSLAYIVDKDDMSIEPKLFERLDIPCSDGFLNTTALIKNVEAHLRRQLQPAMNPLKLALAADTAVKNRSKLVYAIKYDGCLKLSHVSTEFAQKQMNLMDKAFWNSFGQGTYESQIPQARWVHVPFTVPG